MFMEDCEPIGPEMSSTERMSYGELMRVYSHPTSPLLARLENEARGRGHTLAEMAKALGVSYGYYYLLSSGARPIARIKAPLVNACARYLGLPPIMVKLLAGAITMSDFVWPTQPEDELYNRALERMRHDPAVSHLVPTDPAALSLVAKEALVGVYVESSSLDVLGTRQLPLCIDHLQRAAVRMDGYQGEATETNETPRQNKASDIQAPF
jgi:hypothetical protein